jgi:endonuclease YncB( thermonuclease family)
MRNLRIRLLLCGLILAVATVVDAETIVGHVVGVSDGDTITVLDAQRVQHKVRLAGIDAPEKAQPFGNRSKESLSELAFNKDVSVETEKLDRYGRSVGKVLVNGHDVNLVQVERGMA